MRREMGSRDAILGRLRAVAGNVILERGPPPSPVLSCEGDRVSLAEHFGRSLEAVAGEYEFLHDRSQVVERIVQLTTQWSEGAASREVLSWAPEHLPIQGITRTLEASGIAVMVPGHFEDHATRADAARAPVGLTGVDAAIASTGSLVLFSGPGKARVTSLLPLRHLALVPLSRIHASIEHWIEAVRREGSVATVLAEAAQVVFITGPSKSADIELRLTLGVHGPRTVHALVFDDRDV